MNKTKILLLLCIAPMLLSCGTEPSIPVTPGTPAEEPVFGGTIVRRLDGDVATLDFIRHTSSAEKQVLFYLHDRLVEFDDSLRPVPGLAAKWEIEDNGRVWIFHIDPRATFSDGSPVLATDVVTTIRRIVDPESRSIQYAGLWEGVDIDSTTHEGNRTVRVVFGQPRVSMAAFNVAVLKTEGDEALGTGPYVVHERVPGERIVLAARDDYWRDRPSIQTIRFEIIDDDTVAWNALLRGEIDEVRIPSSRWEELSKVGGSIEGVTLHEFFTLSYNFVPWNLRDPLLADVRVRRALAMAFDREAIIEHLYGGGARVITGPTPVDHWASDPTVAPLPYDLDLARKELEGAGWSDPDGDGLLNRGSATLRIEMLLPSGSRMSAEQMQLFQQSLKEIGVELKLTTLDGPTFFGRVLRGDFQSAYLAVDSDVEPDLYPLFHSSQHPGVGQNFFFYQSDEVDGLLDRARSEPDPIERSEIFQAIHRRLAEDQPAMWTIQIPNRWAVRSRVHGVEESKGLGLFLWSPGPRNWWVVDENR